MDFRPHAASLFCATVFCATVLTSCGETSEPPSAEAENTYDIAANAAAMCDIVREDYAYYDTRADAWKAACAAMSDAPTSASRTEAVLAMTNLLNALHDPHVHIQTHAAGATGLSPFWSDYWMRDGVVTAVRPGQSAAAMGLQVGDRVVEIDDMSILDSGKRWLSASPSPTSEHTRWAQEASTAGLRERPRSVMVERDGERVRLDLASVQPAPLVEARDLGDGVGYIRIEDALGNSGLVEAFDRALDDLDPDRLVLDLRNTPSGGNTSVAEPILGRFITTEREYQRFFPRNGDPWIDTVEPRGPHFSGLVAVLVGKWTGSMGEGMAIGMDAMERGTVIGGEMAQLGGSMESYTLPSGIGLSISTQDLRHMDGTPRHEWLPPVRVVADNGNGPDRALEKALDVLGGDQDARPE